MEVKNEAISHIPVCSMQTAGDTCHAVFQRAFTQARRFPMVGRAAIVRDGETVIIPFASGGSQRDVDLRRRAPLDDVGNLLLCDAVHIAGGVFVNLSPCPVIGRVGKVRYGYVRRLRHHVGI